MPRPAPKQSEVDVGHGLGAGWRPQVSYKDGKEVSYGTAGSVRPDWCNTTTCSVEVKNYNIATNSSGLVNNVAQQAIERQANLPAGMRQEVRIDTRGQVVSQAQIDYIVSGIVAKSGGVISSSQIEFVHK